VLTYESLCAILYFPRYVNGPLPILPPGITGGIDFIIPDWLFQGLMDHSLALRIDPAYFALSGGIERWLYRIARQALPGYWSPPSGPAPTTTRIWAARRC
jgi:hypothetical protein